MRKVHLLLIVLGVSATLAGCHSKRAAEAKPAQTFSSETIAGEPHASTAVEADSGAIRPIPKSVNDRRPVLVCFGDSLTAGPGTDPGQSYPEYLQKDLDGLGYHYRVVNEGVSGNTTKDGVDRLPEVLVLHPAVVVVEFGGNDGLRGLPISESRRNLDTIVGTLKKAGITVAIAGITLPPNYGEDYIRQFDETY